MRKVKAREAIINTASRLFYKQGYSNTGINQIIEEASIAKATLYQHFRSKEDLLIAYLQETGAMTLMALNNAARKGNTPTEQILAIFDYLEDLMLGPDFYGCHFLNIVYEMPDGDEKARTQVKKQKDEIRELFESIVKPLNRPELSDEIYTLFEGALMAHKVHRETWPIKSARSIVSKLI